MNNECPRQLLWYVSGVIEPSVRAEIEDHLERCEGCRLEAGALASMMKSLRHQTRADHVGAAELVSYEEGALPAAKSRGRLIENHLAECDPCREDLRTLSLSHGVETRIRRDGFSPRRRWTLAAAAAAALLILASLAQPWTSPPRSPGPVQLDPVVFAAPTRGARVVGSLKGSGPWSARVLLPFGWEAGLYHVVIRREGGAAVAGSEITTRADEDGTLSVMLTLLAPGKYEMSVQPVAAGDEPEEVYPFEVLPAAGRRPSL